MKSSSPSSSDSVTYRFSKLDSKLSFRSSILRFLAAISSFFLSNLASRVDASCSSSWFGVSMGFVHSFFSNYNKMPLHGSWIIVWELNVVPCYSLVPPSPVMTTSSHRANDRPACDRRPLPCNPPQMCSQSESWDRGSRGSSRPCPWSTRRRSKAASCSLLWPFDEVTVLGGHPGRPRRKKFGPWLNNPCRSKSCTSWLVN